MRTSVVLVLAVSAASAFASFEPLRSSTLVARHNRLIRRAANAATEMRRDQRRCKKRPQKKATTPSKAPESFIQAKPSNSSSKSSSPPKQGKKSHSSFSGNLLKVHSNNCGPTGATKESTAVSGPNGNIDWLNCGIEDGGWNPQYVRIEDIVAKSLDDALESPKSPFKACKDFVHIFDKCGGELGIPPIMLASFAMQESSCNPQTVGGGGEQGLMQLTQDKCGGAPDGDCKNPEFNIRTGAQYFADTLKRNNGDLLRSLGTYNGWYVNMTAEKAKAAANTSCCRCQQNLDYLHQFLNGWLQNINAYDMKPRLGKFFNLDVCK